MKLNEMWEDYEEPKLFYRITCEGVVVPEQVNSPQQFINDLKEIGNYFETREEAELAVEKLKALTILNNIGFRIIDWELDFNSVADGKIWFDIGLNTQWDAEQLLEKKPEVKEALDLLFGGEE